MIQFTTQAVTQHLKNIVEEAVQNAYEREFTITIDDVDELHDAVVDSSVLCDTEFGYNQVCAMLPVVFDEVVDYLDDINDFSEDVWGTYQMRESIGFCDF